MSTLDTSRSSVSTDEAVPVAVNALEWDALYGFAGRANTAFGWFTIQDLENGIFCLEFLSDEECFPSLAETKAAAQADFERRVLACIHTSPATLADERLTKENVALLRRAINAEEDEKINREFMRVSDKRWAEEKTRAEAAEAKVAALAEERNEYRAGLHGLRVVYDAERARNAAMDKALTTIRSYFIDKGWEPNSIMIEAIDASLAQPSPEGRQAEEVEGGRHPSHITRDSDASTYDEVCTRCGARDIAGGGWGKLAEPCPAAHSPEPTT